MSGDGLPGRPMRGYPRALARETSGSAGHVVTSATFRLRARSPSPSPRVDDMSGVVSSSSRTGWFDGEHTATASPSPAGGAFRALEEQSRSSPGFGGPLVSTSASPPPLRLGQPRTPEARQQPRPPIIIGGAGPNARRVSPPGSPTSSTCVPPGGETGAQFDRGARRLSRGRRDPDSLVYRPPCRLAAAPTTPKWPAVRSHRT